MSHSSPDVADQRFSTRNARWRAWLRVRTPNVLYHHLGLVMPKTRDCGRHDWYTSDDGIDGCYHCRVTRSTPSTPAG